MRRSTSGKVKNKQLDEFVVGGYLPGKRTVGAVLLRRRDEDGTLRYVGRAGRGLDESDIDRVKDETVIGRCPFEGEPAPPRGSVFVEPDMTVEAEFTDFTQEGVMRHPTIKGEVTVEGRKLKLSNYDKVLWPKTGFTKG